MTSRPVRGRPAAALTLIPALMVAAAGMAYAAGLPLTIEPVNTDALPDVGEEWLTENPYRSMGDEVWKTAIDIGESGFTQNCARCHGLGAISGGLAPDLRFLEADEFGDEWYVERFQNGYTQDGTTRMPAFGELLGQKAAWAIRTYIETRPDEDSVGAYSDRLKELRDQLAAWAEAPADDAEAVVSVREELATIAAEVETGSGAPVADSIALRAARQLDGTPESLKTATETLTIGLSAAH